VDYVNIEHVFSILFSGFILLRPWLAGVKNSILFSGDAALCMLIKRRFYLPRYGRNSSAGTLLLSKFQEIKLGGLIRSKKLINQIHCRNVPEQLNFRRQDNAGSFKILLRDWTVNGVNTLSIWFRGNSDLSFIMPQPFYSSPFLHRFLRKDSYKLFEISQMNAQRT